MAKYEVLHPIRKDDALVKDGLIELDGDEAKIALERGVVRTLPEALTQGKPDPDESSGIANRQTPDNQTGGSRTGLPNDSNASASAIGEADKEMVELFGEDLAGDLHRGGYTSVEQAKGASEENLMAVNGVGKKSVEKIRAALGEGGATGGA